jgi:hypothetical protein
VQVPVLVLILVFYIYIHIYISHQSEAYGILGAFQTSKFSNLDESTTKASFLCNNKAVVKTINKIRKYRIATKLYQSPDFDIISTIHKIWSTTKSRNNGDTCKGASRLTLE